MGADPVTVFLLNPLKAYYDIKHKREELDLEKEQHALEKTKTEALIGKDVPDTSRPVDWGQTIAPGSNIALNRPSPTAPEYRTKHVPGIYERQAATSEANVGLRGAELIQGMMGRGLEKRKVAVQEAEAETGRERTGILRGQLGVQEREAKVRESAEKRAKEAQTVADSKFTEEEVNQRVELLVRRDLEGGTQITTALEPIIGRFYNFIGKGTKLEAYRGLKLLMANQDNKQKLISRLEYAKSLEETGVEADAHIDELIRWVQTDTLADNLMPNAAAAEQANQELLDIERTKAEGRATGQLTEKDMAKAVEDLDKYAFSMFYDKDGKPREPSQAEIDNLRLSASKYGYDIEITKEPGERKWYHLIPLIGGEPTDRLSARIRPQQAGGLRVTGGPEVTPRKPGETIDEYLKRTAK